MPLYAYECEACNLLSEDLRPFDERDNLPCCESCGKPTQRYYGVVGGSSLDAKTTTSGGFDVTLEHINVTSEGPLRFTSKRALKDYCRRNKLSSGALL